MTEISETKYTKKSKQSTLWIVIGAIVFFIAITDIFSNRFETSGESSGFKAAPIEFKTSTYELTSSKSDGDEHTFYFDVANISDNPIDMSTTFKITNGEKQFSSDSSDYSSSEINPDTRGTIAVTFVMSSEDLTQGEPKLEIKRGLFSTEKKSITLEK